jgi:O-antigen ligase
MPTVAAIGTIVFLRNKRIGIVVLILGLLVASPLISQIMATDEYSISTRLDAWIIMAQIIKVNPLLGLGIGNYYWYTPLFAIRGWAVTFNSHNNYVDMIAQIGLLGFGCFVWFVVEIGLLGWRLHERVPEGFAKGYVYGALGGLVATLVAAMLGDWLLSFVYNVGLAGYRTGVVAWIFLGGLVAIEHIYHLDSRSAKMVKSG